MLHAFVLIDATPPRISALCEELAAIDGVTEVFSVAGGVADLIAIVRVRHHDDLADVVTGRIARAERHRADDHAGGLPGLQPPRPRGDVGHRPGLTGPADGTGLTGPA